MDHTILYVDGLPGAGKTSLITSLKAMNRSNLVVWEEKIDQIRLRRMLNDMKRYAFDYQMFRLRESAATFKAALSSAQTGQFVVIDRSVVGDSAFAWNHYLSGNLTDAQWHTYLEALKKLLADMEAASSSVTQLYIYLSASAEQALGRIHRRGRKGESSYSLEYLKSVEAAHMTMYKSLEVQFALAESSERACPPSPTKPCLVAASAFLSSVGMCKE